MAKSPINGTPDLTPTAIDAGWECLKVLDAHKFNVQSAAWVYSSILKEWRFFIVTALVEIDGPAETYDRLERLFAIKFKNKALMIDDVHLGSPREDLFVSLARAIKVPRFRKRHAGIVMKNIKVAHRPDLVYLLENAFIYRNDADLPKAATIKNRKIFDRHLRQLEEATPR
jgi:hypothetical protein